MDDEDTQSDTLLAPPEPEGSSARRREGPTLAPAGYITGDVIGRGGMGVVVGARDRRIGREVAMKRLHVGLSSADAQRRFLREAKVQARLAHPAIVPVYELGVDAEGVLYFTMQRISGATLAERIADGTPLPRLLRAFVDVCRAIELAHDRGVIHRDLKPSNVMLGEFGEVYVLDWGIARIVGEELESKGADGQGTTTAADDATQSGVMLGTPGYMPPEQILGLEITERVDTYALGAVLYEILSRQSLHPRGAAAATSTIATPTKSPSEQFPHLSIPPELDSICVACLAEDPLERPTVHELAERIERFVDGDRDARQRKLIASGLLAEAHQALAAGDRAGASRVAVRAMNLDPENAEVGGLVSHLLLVPPSVHPAELVAEIDRADVSLSKARSRQGQFAYIALIGLAPMLAFVNVRDWSLVAAFYALVVMGLVLARIGAVSGRPRVMAVLLVAFALGVVFTRIASPFVLTPIAIACAIAALSPMNWVLEHPKSFMAWTAATVVVPFGLEALGALHSTWNVEPASLVIESAMLGPLGPIESVGLFVMNLGFMMMLCWLTLTINRQRREAQKRELVLTWHLKQLLPVEVRRDDPG